MEPAHARRDRLHSLDGLRALAVALVFAHHVDQTALPGGFIGVDVFFVLSGYLITYLLLSEHDRYGSIDLRRFYLRRALRLYPALIVMVIVVAIVAAIDNIGRPTDAVFAVTYLEDFWQNVNPDLSLLAHTWSLAVEEQFYLVWPGILIFALRRRWPLQRLVWGLIVASILLTAAIDAIHYGRFDHIQYLPFAHIAELGTGILLAIQVRSGPSSIATRLAHPAVAACALALMLASEIWLKTYWWAFPFDTIICWPIVGCLVLHQSSRVSRAFAWRPAVWLGERSYGFYLWHYPILVFMLLHHVAIGVRIVGGLALTLVIVVASWELVEKPFLRRKGRLERVPDSAIAAAAAAVDAPA